MIKIGYLFEFETNTGLDWVWNPAFNGIRFEKEPYETKPRLLQRIEFPAKGYFYNEKEKTVQKIPKQVTSPKQDVENLKKSINNLNFFRDKYGYNRK